MPTPKVKLGKNITYVKAVDGTAEAVIIDRPTWSSKQHDFMVGR